MALKQRPRWVIGTRAAVKRSLSLLACLFFLGLAAWMLMLWMPGSNYTGELPPLQPEEKILQERLQQDIEELSRNIGERNSNHYENLNRAANFLETSLQSIGYKVQRQTYQINNKSYHNIEVEIRGTQKPNEVIVVGGHYDSVFMSKGANDNGTGAAATLELAIAFASKKPTRTLRFVEFTNEEPPYFWTSNMGSLVYAERSKVRNEKIIAMLSLETMGHFSNALNSQKYPSPLDLFYPKQGNFIGFVGNFHSGDLVKRVVKSFRQHTQFPSEGAALPEFLPGVGWSDHWSFWQQGYPALMVTDTAPFRYPYYHTQMDTADKINYEYLARIVSGLEKVIADLTVELNVGKNYHESL